MINNYTFRMILNEQISDFYGEGHLNIILILHLGMWRKKEVTVTSQVSFANSIASPLFLMVECPRILSLDLFSIHSSLGDFMHFCGF